MLVKKKVTLASLWAKFPEVLSAYSPLLWAILLYCTLLSLLGGAEVLYDARAVALIIGSSLFAVFAVYKGGLGGWPQMPVALKISLLLFVGYAVVQVIPLPPPVWQSLPGQSLRIDVLAAAGLAGSWQPISLTPVYSVYSAVMAVAFAVMLSALTLLNDKEFRRVIIALLIVTVLGMIVGLIQISTGGEFPRFFASADDRALIGFYANKNHMGLALASSLLMAHSLARSDVSRHLSVRVLFYAYWLLVIFCIILTNSRAGLLFGLLASAVVSLPILAKLTLRKRLLALTLTVGIIAIILLSPIATLLLERFSDVADDDRWEIFLRSMTLLDPYQLFGSGLGSFRQIFPTYEVLDWVEPAYLNNAHNDYLQVVIEMGVFGAAALVLLFWAVGGAVIQKSASVNSDRRQQAWTSFVILILFALHSAADYPLRRPAAVAIFIAALAAVLRGLQPAALRTHADLQ